RHSHLKSRKLKLEALQQKLELEHEKLNTKKQSYLKLLQEADFFQKYKQLQKTLDTKRANVLFLEKQLDVLEKIKDLNLEVNQLKTGINSISDDIQELLESGNEYLEAIRAAFNKVIYSVLAKQAQTYIQQNKEGNLDFKAEFFDGIGDATSEAEGNTYKKLLCMAFDLAVLKTYASDSFFHFVYHDGALETLDNRKKLNLLEIIREYCTKYDIQYIFTLIDTDLPRDSSDNKIMFSNEEIIRELHDDGDNGRLFKIPAF
uniref:DUF2326 domain-containing protein n=1 Tax=Candidatus Albibeggiatoa sp. nov. BB20 TaxID=3162723 RepID=UPI0033659FE3